METSSNIQPRSHSLRMSRLSITPRPRDVHDLVERINDADYRDYAEALRSVLARLMLSREKVYDTIFLRGRGR